MTGQLKRDRPESLLKVIDMNRAVKTGLSVIDASTAMEEMVRSEVLLLTWD